MSGDVIVDIPSRKTLERLSHIPTVRDLSTVLLCRESFTDFEKSVVRSNTRDLLSENLPNHWLASDHPDAKSADYICNVFSRKLPTLSEIRKAFHIYGDSISIVGGGTCILGTGYGTDIDANKIVCRLNHPYISEYSKDVGRKTTIHMFNERRLYDYTRGNTRDSFTMLGALNIGVGTTSKTAAFLEYARYLDCGNDPTHIVTLKPSFIATVGALHSTKKPSLGFVAAAFGIRVFGEVTLYAFDLGISSMHYHGIDKVHSSHDLSFEAGELVNCVEKLHNFKIIS
jgi:hypothetical protein